MHNISVRLAKWLILVFSLVSCHVESHMPTPNDSTLGASIIGLTTDTQLTVSNVHLFFFNESDKLISHTEYFDPAMTASQLHNLLPGNYIVVAAINISTAPIFDQTNTLSDITDALKHDADHNQQLRSGMAMTHITAGSVSRTNIVLSQGISGIETATLVVRFQPLPSEIDEYIPDPQPIARESSSLRSHVELIDTKTGIPVAHIVTIPQLQPDGMYAFDITAVKGTYTMIVWIEPEEAQGRYITRHLDMVNVDPETAHMQAGSTLTSRSLLDDLKLSADTTITIDVCPAAACFRIVATDLDEYRIKSVDYPSFYPPFTEVSVTVDYHEYYPFGINLMSGKVTNVTDGFSHTYTFDATGMSGSDITVTRNELLSHAPSSLVITITLTDAVSGRRICRIPEITFDYAPGQLTTLSMPLFTRGVTSGGVINDTDWDEIIIDF